MTPGSTALANPSRQPSRVQVVTLVSQACGQGCVFRLRAQRDRWASRAAPGSPLREAAGAGSLGRVPAELPRASRCAQELQAASDSGRFTNTADCEAQGHRLAVSSVEAEDPRWPQSRDGVKEQKRGRTFSTDRGHGPGECDNRLGREQHAGGFTDLSRGLPTTHTGGRVTPRSPRASLCLGFLHRTRQFLFPEHGGLPA